MSTSPSPASASSNTQFTSTRRFIKRPDDKLKEEKVSKIRSQMKDKDTIIAKLSDQLNKTKMDSTVLDERKLLQQQLGNIVKQQASTKQQRQQLQDQIKSIDNVLKKKITDLNLQTSKNNFKSVEEIDKKINQLDSLIDSGSLKIVDERKTIKEMSSLRKLKKDFGHLELQQKSIDDDKTKIADLKKKLNNVQNKEIQAQFEEISSKLDKINLDNKSINDKRNDIFQKRNAVRKEKDELYHELKKIQEEFDLEYTKFKKLMEEEKIRRSKEDKLYRLNKAKEDMVKDAELQLQNAKLPAFTEEINTVYNLLQHFDPSFERPQTSFLSNASNNNNNNNNKTSKRIITQPDDVIIIKKEPEVFFSGSINKGKKNKKSKATKFTIEPTIIVSLSELGITLPASQDDVANTKTLLLEKLESFKLRQDEQTKINLANAEANKLKVDEKVLELTREIMGDDDEEEDEEKVKENGEEKKKVEEKSKNEDDDENKAEQE